MRSLPIAMATAGLRRGAARCRRGGDRCPRGRRCGRFGCIALAVLSSAAGPLADAAGASERPPGAGGAFVDSVGAPTAFATEAAHRAEAGESAAAGGTVTCTWNVWIEDDDTFAVYDTEGGVQQHSTTGRWLSQTCRDAASGAVTGRIVPEDGIDPETVAQQALRSVDIPGPTIRTSPVTDRGLYVRVPTWLWIDPGWWRPYTATATAGTVTATVEARPVRVVWESGDGGAVTCDGPGQPWAPGLPEDAIGCTYAYSSSSDVQPDGRFRLRATVELEVGWSANTGASGSLGPITRSAEELVQVGEIQAIETR